MRILTEFLVFSVGKGLKDLTLEAQIWLQSLIGLLLTL